MEIVFDHVTMTFGDDVAVKHFTATLNAAGVVGLIGPNGAGKSTLVRMLTTQIKPTEGDILLDGTSIVKHPDLLRTKLGYLPQQIPYYPELTARAYLHYLAAAKGLPRVATDEQIERLLGQLHLDAIHGRRLANYSGGMRQRVAIAASLLGEPQLIVCDEPTVGLDPIERASLRTLYSQLAQTRLVLMSTHIISDIESVANRILLMRQGRLCFDGKPADAISAAQGCVWEVAAPIGKALPDIPISAVKQVSAHEVIRFVADQPVIAGAEQVTPTLEDASLAILEGLVMTHG
ncbi:MAG: ABC transporter ATP-binding protein [Lactobacillus sp.]|jgi:ABC-type multidrug transport system ATPase subunit|nr:ABC transporter ATP-binding protein [Lactobacillus sp.]MCI2032674.1 ABC transporter ATP-binding protein [Lactobacillus sp.]